MSKKIKVGDKFRTNFLSRKPGGDTVVAKMKNGNEITYDKIKHPQAYLKKVLENADVVKAWIV